MELQQALPELSAGLLAQLREGQYVKVIPIVLEGLIKVHTRYEDKELLLYCISHVPLHSFV